MVSLPHVGETLSEDHVKFLEVFARSCRHSSIAMLKNSQSGHTGGSLSCIDYLSLLYTFIISQTGENVIVSNGHISPAVYSVLAEMGYIPKEEVIETFRKIGSKYEGHITRHVDGVVYGTGPLGIGASVAEGIALAKKLKGSDEKVYALIGDGEAEEGQVYEMMNSAVKYKLDNLIFFVDYNKVQLSGSLEEILPLNLKEHFEAAEFHVLETDGHEFKNMWNTLSQAHDLKEKPVVILGHTIMGKGVDFIEEDGRHLKATWHGIAPTPDQADKALEMLKLSDEESALLDEFQKSQVKWIPPKPEFISLGSELKEIKTGVPKVYEAGTVTDCRSAYGNALLDLARENDNVVAISADLSGSVKTAVMGKEFPERHIEVGIAEQNMVSLAGGMSIDGFVPFASTFGAFMSSRAKDQARVNDINQTNVKMVSTHCGVSVGEDGPTHQAIDDMGSFLGLLNTKVIEPADANHTDRIIRYVASHYGNFYVRMGRHKFPVILKEDGTLFYDKDYVYEYGKTDTIREGNDITVIASGACVNESIIACDALKKEDIHIEVIAASSIKKFDQNLIDSIEKNKKVITVEDHNTYSGVGSQIARLIAREKLPLENFSMLGVEEYQLSGTSAELYNKAGISSESIIEVCKSF